MTRLGPSLLFATVLFVLVPRAIIFNNLDEVGPVGPYLMLSAWACAATLVLALASYRFLSPRSARIAARSMFATAVFVFASQIVTPLAMQEIETGSETPGMPGSQIALDMLLIVIVAGLARKLPLALIEKLSLTVGALLAASEIIAGAGVVTRDAEVQRTHQERPFASAEFGGNVYHFVFDSFEGEWWETVLEDLNRQEDFRDFSYFANTRSNFIYTTMSVPSFTTGRLFDGSGSLEQWRDDAFGASTLARAKDLGFVTTSYSLHKFSGNTQAHYSYLATPFTLSLIADIWLLRIVPTFLRTTVFYQGDGVFALKKFVFPTLPSGDVRSYQSLRQFEELEIDEKQRASSGEFVFAHLHPPHKPFQLMRDGRFDPLASSRMEQNYLSVNLMARFLQQLRDGGKYENSLIIFQSDHGDTASPPDWKAGRMALSEMSKDVEAMINASNLGGKSGKYLNDRTRALLVIKPPRTRRKEMRRVEHLAQLADLDRLIMETISGDPGRDFERIASDTLSAKRVEIQSGYWRKSPENGRTIKFGIDFREGLVSRYTVDTAGVWTIESNLSVEW